jgi:uncharacterized protein YkwD
LHFNLVDLVLLAVFGLAAADGLRRGFASYATDFSAFALGLGLAFLLFRPLGALLHAVLEVPSGLASFGCFLIVLVLTYSAAAGWVQPLMRRLSLRLQARLSPDGYRAAGAVPAVGTALVLAVVVLGALVALPGAGYRSVVLSSALGSSLTAPTSFLQPQLQDLLLPAAQEQQVVQGPVPGLGSDENSFYRMRFPAGIETELDVQAEARMLDLLNRSRAEAGLSKLYMDPKLQSVARDHSLDMYRRSYFSHQTPDHLTPFDRLKAAGIQYVTAGENIAYAPDVEQAQESLMSSPDHRANILNPEFRCVGIGVYRGSDGYEEMFTQDFADCVQT